MPITLNHNKSTKAVTVTVTFTADAQVEKPELEAGVIAHHLLTAAANECQRAAQTALTPPDSAAIDAETKAAKDKLDAEAAAKKNPGLTSNVTPNPKEEKK